MKASTACMTSLRNGIAPVTISVSLLLQGVCSMPALADGNVDAMVIDGNLIIEGDGLGNRFTVLGRSISMDPYLITGEDNTTVNGFPEDSLYVTGDVIINTNAGDDRPRIDGNLNTVTVNTGPGNDTAAVGDPVVHGDLVIDTGPGDDLVDIQDTMIIQTLEVDTGAGNDFVNMFFVTIDDDAIIRMNKGKDKAELDNISIDGTIHFED